MSSRECHPSGCDFGDAVRWWMNLLMAIPSGVFRKMILHIHRDVDDEWMDQLMAIERFSKVPAVENAIRPVTISVMPMMNESADSDSVGCFAKWLCIYIVMPMTNESAGGDSVGISQNGFAYTTWGLWRINQLMAILSGVFANCVLHVLIELNWFELNWICHC